MRQTIPMEQGKIRPSVILYSLYWSSPNLVRLITSATPTKVPIFAEFGSVGNYPQYGEIMCDFFYLPIFRAINRAKQNLYMDQQLLKTREKVQIPFVGFIQVRHPRGVKRPQKDSQKLDGPRDDIDSFFTVQNPTATVSVLEQLNKYLQ